MNSRTLLIASVVLGWSAVLPAQERPTTGVVAGNNRFALELYGELKKKPGNLIFAPFSVSTGLAMIATGARGTTFQEMADVLHLPGDAKRTANAFDVLLDKIPARAAQNRGYELTVANALWASKKHALSKDYLGLCDKFFQAGTGELDFTDSPAAAKTVNDWVRQKTQDKIKDVFAPDAFDEGTRLVLANAIHLRGGWDKPFPKETTRNGDFLRADGKKVQTPMMVQTGSFPYLETMKGYEVVALPYKDDRLSLVVFLPFEQVAIEDFEKKLTTDLVTKAIDLLKPTANLEVTLPKFRLVGDHDLEATLKALGMRQAFEADRADLSGMSSDKTKLCLSKLRHKTYIDVNEFGTEAAAATVVEAKATAKPMQFTADRPFVFVIHHNPTGSIVFMGRVADPTAP